MNQNESDHERWYRCEQCGWSGQDPPRDDDGPYCPDCEQSTDERRLVARDE